MKITDRRVNNTMSTNTTPEFKYFTLDMKDIAPDWSPENNDLMMAAVKQTGQQQKARAKAIIVKECEVYAQLWEECAKQAWVPVVGCNQQLNDRWNCMKEKSVRRIFRIIAI